MEGSCESWTGYYRMRVTLYRDDVVSEETRRKIRERLLASDKRRGKK